MKPNNSMSNVRDKVVKSNKQKTDWREKWNYLLNKKKDWKNPDEVNKVLTEFVEKHFTQ
jgi:hypothetical protein